MADMDPGLRREDNGRGTGVPAAGMVEGFERQAKARRGIVKRIYGFLLRPEASVIVVSVALVVYFELANQNFLTNANIQTLSQFVAAPVIIACGRDHAVDLPRDRSVGRAGFRARAVSDGKHP
jgi:hypothetical protein